ncbi:hypothetical protein HHL17_20525 [Chitinophaga sp. G-6-1-13]|uniref:Uncharacterized protein n=1 Tax=Chitinophaga fulva TaxID=2728842 RepID=A0A848GNR7_9BACT|nr:hypothetical protein [Chitinophaga fulva]NML39597.1 hypothetical protein [Chitinophaga fulva]
MKMKLKLLAALKIWLVIYPSITLFWFLFGQALSTLPLFLRTLVLTAVLVPWMVFVGMPLLDAAFRLIGLKRENK